MRPLGAVLASAALALAVPSLAAAQQQPLAIRGARVVTVSGPVIEKGTVLVERGRIAAVGRDADVAVPAGASVVDASGKTLYPGLVDALTTLGLAEVQAVQATSTRPRSATWTRRRHAWIALHPDSELIPSRAPTASPPS